MIQLPFADRLDAGQPLSRDLACHAKAQNTVVLGLARGGVSLASAIADELCLPLDVIVARKLGVPGQPELAMGALAGTARILNIATIRELGISDRELGQVALREQSEMQRREQLYRGGRPAAALQGKIAIVVDDGLATGSTMMAAVRYIRSLSPEKVIVAIPVGSREAVSRLRREADDVICITIPESFYAVGQWYRDFTQVSDDEVRNLLAANHRRHAKRLTSSAAG